MPIPAIIAAKLLAPMAAKLAAPTVAAALPAASGMLGPIVTAPNYAAPLLGPQGIGGQFTAPDGALPPSPQVGAGGGPQFGGSAALPQMAQAPSIDLSRPGGGYSAPARRRTAIPRLNLP